MNITYLTKKGLNELRNKVVMLQNEIKECNRKIGITVSLDNDLRENPEFMALRTKAEYELPAKLQEINSILERYQLIEEMEHILSNDLEYINLGHEVTLLSGNIIRKITILGYGDSVPEKGIVSYLTPIAESLLELSVRDEIPLSFNGKKVNFLIDDIKRSDLLEV